MEPEKTPHPKRLHFALLLIISFSAIPLGYAIEQAFRWTNPMDGFLSGLIQGAVLGLAWCAIYILPWSLIVFGLYRWRGWQRFRSQWILAPSLIVLMVMLGGLLVEPTTPAKRFKRFTKTELPLNAQDLHTHFTGGGFADYSDTYFFTTTPSELDRLIDDLGLSEDIHYGVAGMAPTPIEQLPGCPDFNSWKDAKQFKKWDEEHYRFYYLVTDSTRTQVYFKIICI
jgi:hypothetical protein